MRVKAILALSLALTLTCVDQSEGLDCYGCKSTSVDGCKSFPGDRRRLICGTNTPNYDYTLYLRTFDDALDHSYLKFKKRQRFYENKREYIAKFELMTVYMYGVREIMKLKAKPPPLYQDDVDEVYEKKRVGFEKYKDLWIKLDKEDEAKVEGHWVKLSPQLKAMKAAWKGAKDMPEPPRWSQIYDYTLGDLQYEEYEEMLDDWIQAANKAMAAGEYNDSFHENVRSKWRKYNYDKRDGFFKYKGTGFKEPWGMENTNKGERIYAKILPELKQMKAAWKGTEDMPEPPRWSQIYSFANTLLRHDEYEELLEDWIQAARKAIAAGEFKDRFHEKVRSKWRVIHYNEDDIKGTRRKRQVPGNTGVLFENLPLDDSWCVSFRSPSLGIRMGCGVQLKGFVFQDGCHQMSAPYEGIKYCRCDGRMCDVGNGTHEPVPAPEDLRDDPFNGNSPPAKPDSTSPDSTSSHFYKPSLSDSARQFPCLLLLLAALLVTVTS